VAADRKDTGSKPIAQNDLPVWVLPERPLSRIDRSYDPNRTDPQTRIFMPRNSTVRLVLCAAIAFGICSCPRRRSPWRRSDRPAAPLGAKSPDASSVARPSESAERAGMRAGSGVSRNRVTNRCVGRCQAVSAIQWLWSLRMLWVAATSRHSDCAAALPLRMNRSVRRLYLICP
jgi:hypothetical protein